MHALAVIVALLGVGAVVTLIGTRLIERAHPPRGRLIDIDGNRQHVVELGQYGGGRAGAPPIVLLHGAGSNLEDMRLAIGERLAERYRVILVDRPGQGWSERAGRRGNSPTAQAAVLRKLLDKLAVDRAIVVGQSWGGTLAASFALDYPERVAGLALLAPPTHPRLRRLALFYAALAGPFLSRIFAHTLALPLAAASMGLGVRVAFLPQAPPPNYLKRSAIFLLLRPAAFLGNARDIAGLQSFLARQAVRYRSLAMPTIILQGDQDRIVSLQDHAMAFAASAPSAKLVVLPGVGHMLHHAVPQTVIAAIEELIAQSK